MAIGAAIVSVAMSVRGAKQQRRAGRAAQTAAEEGARGIEAETETNIAQAKRSQAQTMGTAVAMAAARGAKFDARKISRVQFSEGGTKEERVKVGIKQVGTTKPRYSGRNQPTGEPQQDIYEDVYETREVEQDYGKQVAGAAEGGSAFTYLKEMKRSFATDIGYMSEAGRSRARVARMGGKVAAAQAKAGATASYASAFSTASSAFRSS